MKVGSLRYGVIFKKAFSVPEIFTAFVDDFTGVRMKIDKVETEKSFDPPIGWVDCRFDLFAEDRRNRVIVDIQHVRFGDHYHRFLHYHCAALLDQVRSAGDYTPELRVFTLVVLTSGDRHRKDIGITDFDPKDIKGNAFGEIPHKIIYICPKYVTAETPERYREWMLAIDDTLDEEVDESAYTRPEIREIFHRIERDRISPKERAAMKDEYSIQMLGEDEFQKGFKKGAEKGARQIVLNMVSNRLTHEEIAEMTGLPPERVRDLALKPEDES